MGLDGVRGGGDAKSVPRTPESPRQKCTRMEITGGSKISDDFIPRQTPSDSRNPNNFVKVIPNEHHVAVRILDPRIDAPGDHPLFRRALFSLQYAGLRCAEPLK